LPEIIDLIFNIKVEIAAGAFKIVVFIPFRVLYIRCIGNPREQGRCICGAMEQWSNGASSIVGSRDIQQWGNQQWACPLPQEQKRQFEIHPLQLVK
jgi:hypothetical protein